MLGRSWYRFSLRSLLVACAVCCAALAVWRWCFAPDPVVAELESLNCAVWDNRLSGSNRLHSSDITDVSVMLPQARNTDAERINQLLRQLPSFVNLHFHDDDTGGMRDPRIDAQSAILLNGLTLKQVNFSCHAGAETAKVLSQTKSLRSVGFGCSPADSMIQSLVRFHSRLQYVSIHEADVSTLDLLSREPNLIRLHLTEPKLAGLSTLERLPKSVEIYLSLATLDDDSLLALSRLSFPFHLRAYGSKFSDEGLAAFETAQTPLLQIDMNSPHVTDLGLSRLSRVRDLEVVNFDPLSATENGIIELLNAGKEIHVHSQRFDIEEVRRRCPEAQIEANVYGGFDLVPPTR